MCLHTLRVCVCVCLREKERKMEKECVHSQSFLFIRIFKYAVKLILKSGKFNIWRLNWFTTDNISIVLFYFLCYYRCILKRFDISTNAFCKHNVIGHFAKIPKLLCYNSTTWWPTPSHEQPHALQALECEPSSRLMISCCFILILLVGSHFWLGKCHSTTTTKSLPRGFNTDEPSCMCLFKKS